MKLIILTAVLAVCGAARKDRSYVPTLSSRTGASSSGTLLTPIEKSSHDGVPTGGYTNDALGVVVDAAAPGTRTVGAEPTGLGGPRTSYGSTDSKVGDAAFSGGASGFGGPGGALTRIAPGFEAITGEKGNTGGSTTRIAPGFESILSYGSDNAKPHANTLKFSNEIGLDKYSYGFETDNGIAIGEKGVSGDGVNANGGYSYKGNDGKTYSVSYTADKNGYKPHGSHLPTPPPIPKEILVSLEKNAEEEAAGVVDDGSYDAQKYNDEGDYTSNNADNNNNGPSTSSKDTSSGTSFVSHSNQANSPVSPTGEPTGNSAFSSAVVTGSGSASAYAGTGPSQTGFKNQYTYGFNPHGASGSSVSAPLSSTASASVSGKEPYFGVNSFPSRFGQNQNSFGQASGANVQSQTQSGSLNLFGTGQSSAAPTNVPATDISTTFEPGVSSESGKPSVSSSLSSSSNTVPLPTQPSFSSSQETTQSGSVFQSQTGQYKPQTSQSTFGQIGSGNTNFASNSLKPTYSTTFGSGSYSYNQPQKPLVTSEHHVSKLPSNQAIGSSTFGNSGQYSHNYQPNVPVSSVFKPGYSNAPIVTTVSPIASTQSGKHQGSTTSSYYNGLTQASVSPFPLASSTPSTQFQTQTSTFGQTSSQAQFGSAGSQQAVTQFGQKPIVQSQSGQYSQTENTQSQQGTIYEYNKPATVNQQTGTQFGSKPIVQSQSGYTQTGNTQTQSQQGTIYEYNKPATVNQQTGTLFGSKPIVQSQSAVTQTGNTQTQSQQGTIYEYNKPATVNQQTGTQFGSKPIVQSQSGYTQTGNTQTQSQQGIVFEFNKPSTVSHHTGNQFGSKPIVQSQSGFTQTGNTQTESQQGIVFEYNKPSTVSQQTGTQFGSKPIVQSQSGYTQTQSQQGTIYEYNKPTSNKETTPQSTVEQVTSTQAPFVSQGTQLGNQATNAFGSTSGQQTTFQQTQSQGTVFGSQPVAQSGQKDSVSSSFTQTQFGQKPFANSQTTSTFQQSQTGAQESQFAQNSGTSAQSVIQQNQGTVYEYNKPVNALTQTDSNSASSGSQIVQGTTSQSGVVVQTQNTQSSDKPSSDSQTSSALESGKYDSQQASLFAQKVTGSQYVQKPSGALPTSIPTRFGEKPSTGFGSTSQGQQSQYGQHNFGSFQTGSKFQQTQFGSSFGQKPQTGSNLQQTQFGSSYGQKPQTGSNFQQTQFGSSFGQKPQTGSNFQQTQFGSSYGQKPQTGSNFQQTQFGSSFGQKPSTQTQTLFGQQPSTSQIGYGFQQTAFGTSTGSRFGQKPQTVFTSGTYYKGQAQFGQQNFGSPSTSQTVKPAVSQFGQNLQTVQNTGLTTGLFSQTTTSKPVGSSQTGSYFQQIGQTPQTNQGSSFSITPSKGQSAQTSQFGQTQNAGSGLTQTQYGSSTGTKPQFGFGTVSTTTPQVQPISQYGIKPVGSQYTHNTFQQTSTTGSQFGQKVPSNAGTVFTTSQVQPFNQFSKKPFGSLATQNTFPQTQFGSNSVSAVGQTNEAVSQTSSFGQKPAAGSFGGNTFSTTTQAPQFQGTQFGSSLASQANKGSSFSIGTGSTGQTTQFGVKPFGSSQTFGSNYSQNKYGSSLASQNSQNTQSGFGTFSTVTPQVVPISQYGHKPFGSQYTPSAFTQTQYGTSFGSRFGEKGTTTGTVPVTTTSFVQKPIGVSQTASSFEQTQFGSSSSSVTPIKGQSVQTTQTGVKPFGSSQTSGSTFSQSQFGAFGAQKGQNSQSGLNTFSTTTQAPQLQGTQFGSSFGSQANKGNLFSIGSESKGQSSQIGVKPFGSSQTLGSSYPQNQYGSLIASQNNQNTQSGVGAVTTTTPQVQEIYNGQKPFGSLPTQNTFTQTQLGSSQFGNQQTVGTTPTSTLVQLPIGVSQTGSSYQQTQFGSSSSSLENTGALTNQGNQGQVVQTIQGVKPDPYPVNSFPQTQFGTLGSQKVNQQSGVGTFSTTTQAPQYQGSQFGVSTGSQSGQTQFNQKPFGSTQNTGSSYQQTQSGSQFGSNFNVKPQTTFGTQSSSSLFGQSSQSQFGTQAKKPYVSPFSTQFGSTFGQKPQASASAFASSAPSFGGAQIGQVSKYQSTQFGTSGIQAANTFGGSQSVQGQTTQTSSQFGVQPQKPFGTSQFTYQQSQLTGIKKPVGSQSAFQYGQSTPSTIGSFSLIPSKEQNAFSTVSRFGEVSKIEGQHTYQSTIAPLEYSTSFASAEGYGSSTPASIVSSTPQTFYYSTPVSETVSTTPSTFVSTTSFGSKPVTSKPAVTVTTVETPVTGVVINNQQAGFVERYVENRNPPSFNRLTGYHY